MTPPNTPILSETSPRQKVLPLEPGDRLTRAEFERRYAAMPLVKKAELIEGVVYMPSPVRVQRHGHPHLHLGTWLGVYESGTPGVLAPTILQHDSISSTNRNRTCYYSSSLNAAVRRGSPLTITSK